jgi:hypothetical protein
MNNWGKFKNSLGKHPGVMPAAIFTIMGFFAGLKSGSIFGGLGGALIMSIFWIPVLCTAWTMRNSYEQDDGKA